MPTKPSPVTLRTRYTDQAVADLEENRRRQAELRSHLEVLQQEETLLLDILNLTGKPAANPGAAPPSEATESPSASSSATPAPTEPSPDTLASAGDPPVPSRPEHRGGSVQQPLLREVLLDLLSAYNEPRTAKELWQEYLQNQPDRSPSNQVVRNTLEGLVARGLVTRHKQKRTVLYTLTEAN
ncbi:hypothetical protein HCJ76_31760 [Streptomyces sp. MC1]|uniref:hypothetical protein n=1 Tax=Streptomyces sp. MC1 TaxID=295105 RepID=UPI0018CBE773|nr:hypothetical protein [Streptomyces sp. MC1]MBG7702518.1 hypothetical protein [Streptomyces sp. MC1]